MARICNAPNRPKPGCAAREDLFSVAITQDDLARAKSRVISAERLGFAAYLSVHWQPESSVCQRLDPKGCEQAREALIEVMGDEFATRSQTRLREKRLENDADAKRLAGP